MRTKLIVFFIVMGVGIVGAYRMDRVSIVHDRL